MLPLLLTLWVQPALRWALFGYQWNRLRLTVLVTQ